MNASSGVRSCFMQFDQILKTRMGKQECLALVAYVLENPDSYRQLLDYVTNGTDAQAMKASWVMAHIRKRDDSFSLQYQTKLLQLLTVAEIGGVQRELLKCLEGLPLNEVNEQLLLNYTWAGLTTMEYDFAVRYLCLRVLRFYAKRNPEFLIELKSIESIQMEKTGRFP